MLNYIWLGLILCGVMLGVLTGRTEAVTLAAFDAAKSSLMTIALPLGAMMALWLGIMRLAEKSGAVEKLASLLQPVLKRLFPEVPPDHPAMGAMVMNIAANMLRPGECSDTARVACHAESGIAESTAGNRDKRDVHLPCNQHQFGSIDTRDRNRHPRRGGIPTPDGHHRHGACCNDLFLPDRNHLSETPAASPDLRTPSLERDQSPRLHVLPRDSPRPEPNFPSFSGKSFFSLSM